MITKWKLFNFKSIRGETELPLGPLTILAGPNSSGKSTLTQSMLLISQTLSSRVNSRSVVLNGHLIKLGQFDDLRSFGSEADQILIGWDCEPQSDRRSTISEGAGPARQPTIRWRRVADRLENVSCEISFDVDPSSPQRDLLQLQPRLFGCTMSCLTRTEDNIDVRSSITVSRARQQTDKSRMLEIPEPDDEVTLSSLEYDVELDENSMNKLRNELTLVEPVGCVFRHFLPSRLSVHFNEVEVEAHLIAATICDIRFRLPSWSRYVHPDDKKIAIPTSVVNLLKEHLGESVQPIIEPVGQQLTLFEEDISPSLTARDWYERIRKLHRQDRLNLRRALQEQELALSDEIRKLVMTERSNQYALGQGPPPRDITGAVRYLDFFFSNSVKYLGPLRDEPKPLYPLAATVDPSDVGLRGEYTAAVLDLHKERHIVYIPTTSFSAPDVKTRRTPVRTLKAAVLDWLQYMGIAEDVETRDRGKLGHELKVVTSGTDTPQDLTHVGVGVSQVLPILVMCLLAETDTTLIIEQPELHLHPKVQTLLGDFFLSMAMLGKQCIVETHSEYIINRLRLRAASAPDETISSLMKVYFVEKRDGMSLFRDVVVNRYGAVIEWPEGFFDQSQREAEEILRAALAKRKQERQERTKND